MLIEVKGNRQHSGLMSKNNENQKKKVDRIGYTMIGCCLRQFPSHWISSTKDDSGEIWALVNTEWNL